MGNVTSLLSGSSNAIDKQIAQAFKGDGTTANPGNGYGTYSLNIYLPYSTKNITVSYFNTENKPELDDAWFDKLILSNNFHC